MADSEKPPVATSQKTIRIVEELKEMRTARLTELANRLEMNKSTVYNHLMTLESEELVVREGNRYRLGLRFLDFGGSIRRQIPLYDVAKPELDRTASQTSEMANLMVEEFGRGVYLDSVTGAPEMNIDIYPGQRVPLHASSLGKAILAEFSDERIDEIIDKHGLTAHAERTITNRDDLFEEIETVRDQGFAVDDEEFMRGLRCVGAAITAANGDTLGAVGISAPTAHVDDQRFFNEFPDIVQSARNVIQLNLG